MKSSKLKEEISCVLHSGIPEISENHLRQTIFLTGECYQKHRKKERIGFGGLLLRQFRFIGWKMWLVQGLYLFLFIKAIRFLFHIEVMGVRHISYMLCLSSVMIAWTMVPIIGRSIRFRMFEIENAALFSGGRLLIVQLLVIGGGGLPVLGTAFWLMTRRYLYQFSEVAFAMFLPLLAVISLFLYLFRRMRNEVVVKSCNIAGGICIAAIILTAKSGTCNLMELPRTGGWLACVICLVVCVVQIKAIWSGNYLMEKAVY